MRVLVLMGALAVGFVFLSAVFVCLGARWVKAAKATFPRALAAWGCVTVASVLFLGIWKSINDVRETSGAWASCLAFVVLLGVELTVYFLLIKLLIKRLLGTSALRAFLALLVGVIPQVLAAALVLLVIRPYVAQAFVLSTNSMAPTILGPHFKVPCPRCGGTVFISPPPKDRLMIQTGPGICGSCLAQEVHPFPSSHSLPPDHVFVDKLAAPRRWDMVTFRSPSNPSVVWVKRVVALPGEEVVLKDGAVWVNGVKQTPPAPMARLEYAPLAGQRPGPLDSPDRPWRLKADEFCVLGDFTTNSVDSRMIGAVPRSSIVGVVTVLYWPPARWQVWR